MGLPENNAAAMHVGEQVRKTEEDRLHAIAAVNQLRRFLFGDDEGYMDPSFNYDVEDQYDLMSAVWRHYGEHPDAQKDPLTIVIPSEEFRKSCEPEVNQAEFTISMSPFFIKGFRVAQKIHDEDPFRGRFILKDTIVYSEFSRQLLLDRDAYRKRLFTTYRGSEARVPTSDEVRAVADMIQAGQVKAAPKSKT